MNFFHGTGVALFTPFSEDLSVDYSSLKKLLNHLEGSVDYFLVHENTSESATASDLEKKEILSFIISKKSPNTPIVYGLSLCRRYVRLPLIDAMYNGE